MRDTEREARLEEIRARMEAIQRRDVFIKSAAMAKLDSDRQELIRHADWLLSEIERLRKVEGAAREVMHTDTEPCTCGEAPYEPCAYCGPFESLLRALHEGDDDA